MYRVFMLYEVNPTTWFYISSLLIIGIFFKFRRVWSIRNLDLMMLLFLAPGMLMVANGFEYRGYCTLFVVSFLLLLRMVCDPFLVRRPLLEVNLSRSGMTFSCIALLFFLIAGLTLTQWRAPGSPQTATVQQLLRQKHIQRILLEEEQNSVRDSSPNSLTREEFRQESEGKDQAGIPYKPMITHGPGVPFFTEFINFPLKYLIEKTRQQYLSDRELSPAGAGSLQSAVGMNLSQGSEFQLPAGQTKRIPGFPILNSENKSFTFQILATHTVAILGQIAIILGIIFIGSVHFENMGTGIAAATLYLLLPYSAQIPARLDHIVPAALLVWAVFCYRLPSFAGVLIGFAAALAYYPIFLIPLWCGFYWSRGLLRFMTVSLATFVILIALAIFMVGGIEMFWHQLEETFSFAGVMSRNAGGFWNQDNNNLFFRIPVISLYVILATVLAFWPSQKNFGTLMSSSAALMIGCQFCHPFEGGLYMAWYLPLLILVIFRPNLEDRIAIRALMKRGAFHSAVQADPSASVAGGE
ncbi:MAG: hypothetical protein Q4C96_06540 [Planctomycetia bacterium]|nr:hypothetical protein [Planctomycetia bacterium]